MKKILTLTLLAISLFMSNATLAHPNPIFKTTKKSKAKIEIKIKNDLEDEISVINAGSGGSYRLSKNVVTTIKMEAGDKLYFYTNGKKGKLILTAATDMNGKVQLLSKL
jgi:hypothetical protein